MKTTLRNHPRECDYCRRECECGRSDCPKDPKNRSDAELDEKIERLGREVGLLLELIKLTRIGWATQAEAAVLVTFYEERLNKVLEVRDRLCNERGDALMCNL